MAELVRGSDDKCDDDAPRLGDPWGSFSCQAGVYVHDGDRPSRGELAAARANQRAVVERLLVNGENVDVPGHFGPEIWRCSPSDDGMYTVGADGHRLQSWPAVACEVRQPGYPPFTFVTSPASLPMRVRFRR